MTELTLSLKGAQLNCPPFMACMDCTSGRDSVTDGIRHWS